MEKLKDDYISMEYRNQSDFNWNMENTTSADTRNVNDKWRLRAIFTPTADKPLGNIKGKVNRKSWITGDMIEKMEEGRTWKSVNIEGQKMYKMANNQLRRQTNRARNKWWEEQ